MKSLLLIRHAKSSWDNFSIKDFDRPLNDRGKRDAPVMAQRLMSKKIVPDALVASPAKRAKKTAELFAAEFKKKEEEIIFIDELYLATPSIFFDVISNLDDALEQVAIFSHNNGITEFANLLSSTRIDDMPTCSIFAVKIQADHWRDFKNAEKDFWFFDAPKLNRS